MRAAARAISLIIGAFMGIPKLRSLFHRKLPHVFRDREADIAHVIKYPDRNDTLSTSMVS